MAAPRGTSPIATAMAVLRCFSPDRPVLGVVEIAEEVGVHKSSVSRMLTTLEAEELVERDPVSKKYRLGLGLLGVAGALLAHLDVRRAAAPVLAALTQRTGETSSLMLWDGHGAITVEQVPSPHPVKHSAELGTRYRNVTNSSVRVFLADMPDDERTEALGSAAARREYARLSARDGDGTTLNLGDRAPDEVGISAPVHDHRGDLIAAVLLAAPRYRVDENSLDELRQACRDAAAELTMRLGGRPA